MPLSVQILALVAAALHVLFFYLEAVAFSKPSTWKTFGVESQEAAQHVKPWALNQGFYNLFLALGVIVAVIWQFVTTPLGDALAEAVARAGQASNTGAAPRWALEHGTTGHITPEWTSGVIVFGLLCMLGAALVLAISSRGRLMRGALIQGLVPAVALLIALLA